jgi:hypothetical protein
VISCDVCPVSEGLFADVTVSCVSFDYLGCCLIGRGVKHSFLLFAIRVVFPSFLFYPATILTIVPPVLMKFLTLQTWSRESHSGRTA